VTSATTTATERWVAAAFGWMALGACGDKDPEEMYPDGKARQREVAEFCHLACPVRAQCLEYAIAEAEAHGVWGGTTEQERARLIRAARKRRAGAA
jgi:WhiB family redox-sensing transcriptional regulator